MTVEIRLLGPVEVITDAKPVPLGGPRLRTLVGALALRAPDVVSRDTLIDGIWDARPPVNAAKTLRAHVAYLRRSLVAGGVAELIATRSPGYALTVPAGCVDAHRFQELVARARGTPGAEAAAASLRAALGLWRGDVLAGCPAGEWIRAEATRLHEVRLSATEELLGTELELGRHAGAVAELEAVVARNPLRERLWELLMRALYLAGRQGDALRAYRRARATLIAEIGVEPGQRLRRLEAAILAGEDLAVPPAPVAVPKPRAAASAGPAAPIGPAGPAGAAGSAGLVGAAGAVPTPLTNLVGRRAEIAEVSGLLAERRLLTLTGVGGCGKTRLAIAVAQAVAGRFADGVRFVDLTPLADPDLVAGTVAAVLEVPVDATAGTVAALAGHLRERHCLLVLDNCEHVVRSCARLVATLLRCCPTLRVLATSRETLGVLGELAWPVPPLPTPPARGPCTLDEVRRYDAVRLFLDRATVAAVRDLTDADAPAITALCAGLDGLPLAIELAAARTAVLTVTEIADRLHDPSLLHAGRHPERPHHRALDATIAWSYDLLDPPAQARFRRLAVFAGGFTLAAAEAVWAECDAVDALADLTAKSLVVMERHATGARYRLLETIGRWAAARLAECPADERDARRRHAEHYLALAEEADRRLPGPDMGSWLDRLAVEQENLRSAFAWFAGDGGNPPDPSARLRLAVALARYCQLRGRYADGRRWLDAALAGAPAGALDGALDGAPAGATGAGPELVGQAFWAIATFALLTCDYDDAQRTAEQALTVQRRCGDEPGVARTLRLLACVARERGEYRRSLDALDEAMAVVGAGEQAVAGVLQQVGFTRWLAGDLDGADRALAGALRRYERLGDPDGTASTQLHSAAVALYRGHLDLAERLAGEGLDRFTELDVAEGIAWAFDIIGVVALRRGRHREAVDALRTSLDLHCTVGDRWRQASVLAALAAAAFAAGEPVWAAELAGLSAAVRGALRVPVPAQERPAWEHVQAALRRCLPDAERAAAEARGAAMRVPQVIATLDYRLPTATGVGTVARCTPTPSSVTG